MKTIIELFQTTIRMVCNVQNSSLSTLNIKPDIIEWINSIFEFDIGYPSHGIRYLGFLIKPNDYLKKF